MIFMTTNEVADLKDAQRTLEQILATLDHAGAGIAAIHVNAAIEQLKKNLRAIDAQAENADGARFFFPDQNQ